MSAVTARSGWYEAGDTGTRRWWDGARWTPHRLTDAGPKVDLTAIEPLWLGYFLGSLMLVSSSSSFVLGAVLLITEHRLLDGEPTGGPASMPWIIFTVGCLPLAVAVYCFVGAIRMGLLRRVPAPTGAPDLRDGIRPLPEEQEGPGAGWYRVATGIQRWWTGERWSWYISSKYGPRPGFSGPRMYRIQMVLALVIVGLAILFGIVGIVFAVVYPAAAVLMIIAAILFGGLLLILGGVVLAMTWFRRHALILPAGPPDPQSRVEA